MTERLGDWMQTYTGKAFWPLDPRASEVDIEDIAHALSLQCRFAGHCRFHYSVAQHSVLVARALPVEIRAWGLLHDAAEAYLVDLPRPVKGSMPAYWTIEDTLLGVIAAHFEMALPIPPEVFVADNTALATEKRDVMDLCNRAWHPLPDPWPERIRQWQPREAERWFLEMAVELDLRGAFEALRVMA